ncbi:hypothetical protein [Leucobacter chinensis]|uniref:hypothetical protein n=1 Tax=Leucobacter chinensis TaxID=2851010 RepID=UPI001C22A8BA|nr:hypothetical protein [Leucobacter chinensis]
MTNRNPHGDAPACGEWPSHEALRYSVPLVRPVVRVAAAERDERHGEQGRTRERKQHDTQREQRRPALVLPQQRMRDFAKAREGECEARE